MSSTSESVAQQLSTLLDELDEDSLAKMSDDEVLALRKQLNPYGRTIQGSDKVLTFSYTDLQFERVKKLITTTMIGFLNRMCDEWRVPDGIPVIPVHEYVQNPEKIDEFEKTLQKPELMADDIKENKENMIKRVAIKEFLEDMFQYNPDLHVRSAYKPNPKDDERQILDTPAAHLAINRLRRRDAEFNEEMMQYEREKALAAKVSAEGKDDTKSADADKTVPPEKVVSAVREETTKMIPPADVYHRFQYYYDSNYEELQHIVTDLYCDKPEFETAINPYAWHDDDEKAEEFISKHKDEVISTIFKAHSGKWNIIAPYKKVRESMRYFNKKTAVLEQIAKQIESDAKMGQELMSKRIVRRKKKNIAKDGPDDPAFLKWRESNSTLKDMGAVAPKKGDYEDDDDCPDDAIEVPVFRIGAGGTTLEKTKFFTEAVAPDLPDPNAGASGPSAGAPVPKV